MHGLKLNALWKRPAMSICDPSAQNQSQVAFLTFWVWCTIWKRNASSL